MRKQKLEQMGSTEPSVIESSPNSSPQPEVEDVATRLRRRLDQRSPVGVTKKAQNSQEAPQRIPNMTPPPEQEARKPPQPTPRRLTPPPIPRRKSVCDLKKQFSLPLVQKEPQPTISKASTPTNSDEGMCADLI